ncbi:MAG TPA: hypothetical protein VL361_27665 [Candidatus Limnocylindrales bacterium]|nr:hypothetical protein [Candidatus Limnocylindrales bacterium]
MFKTIVPAAVTGSRKPQLRQAVHYFIYGWLVILSGGCASQKASQSPDLPPEPYVRISNNDSNLVQLQIAVRKFVPARGHGPAIWLAGVSHIGDSNYYAALQEHLDAQTLVLFEGVAARARPSTPTSPRQAAHRDDASDKGSSSADDAGLQSSVATSLGLEFQLTAIDYQRPNFRNCDLTIPELRQLFAAEETSTGSSGAGESFEGVLQLMQGGSFFDSVLQVGLRFLGASPKLRALGRLALIDVIGEIQGDFSHLQGLPPNMKELLQVLLERRNQKVVRELTNDLPRLDEDDTIAVFYGTAHMPDLERRLRTELKYRPVTQLWLTAFSVNLAQSEVSENERALVQTLIKQQLAPFQKNKAESKVQ